MIFDISHWALTQRIEADALALQQEFQEQVKPRMAIKPQTRTSFEYELFQGSVGMFSLRMDPTLWSGDEMKMYGNGDYSPRKFNQQCKVAWSIIDDFPAIRQMYWTTITPGVEFNPHYGVGGVIAGKVAEQLRIQFCWDTTSGAEFHIESHYLEYVPGLKFGFHEGMDLHWAFNKGEEPRTVLIIDVWKNQVESDNIEHPAAIRKTP